MSANSPSPLKAQQHDQDEDIYMHWDQWDVPETHYSLPALMHQDLTRIRREHAAWAYELGKTTIDGKRVDQWLCQGAELSMWWCSLLYERHPKMTPFLYPLFKLLTLEHFLAGKETIGKIVQLGGEETIAGILRDFCTKTGKDFVWENSSSTKKTITLSAVYRGLPALIRAAVRFFDWLIRVKRLLPRRRLRKAEGETATIATYFPNIDLEMAKSGRFRSRYWEKLHELLNEEAERLGRHFVRWLFIRFPSPQGSLKDCIRYRDAFDAQKKDGISFHYLEEFLSFRDLLKSLRDFLALSFTSRRLEKKIFPHFHLTNSHIDFAPLAKADWIESFRGWRSLERTMQRRAFMNFVQECGPSRFTLFPLENCPWERMLTFAVHKAHNGPVYGAQHSTLRPSDLRYFDDPRIFQGNQDGPPVPDKILGNGRSACEQWRNALVPPELLGKVEALRYLYLETAQKEEVQQTSISPARCERPRLLLLTSFFRDETAEHMRLFLKASQAGLLDGYTIILKPHPYLPLAPYLTGLNHPHCTIGEGKIEDYLIQGTLVWASNSTSAALEAAINGLAVAVMRPTGDFDLSPLQSCKDLLRTGSLKDVALMLEKAAPLTLPADYLLLDNTLTSWRKLLIKTR